jgi:hypothetical protein
LQDRYSITSTAMASNISLDYLVSECKQLRRNFNAKRSGGEHTVAGLAQLRSDIGCGVITSGTISVRSNFRDSGHPIVGKHRFYDPIDHVNTGSLPITSATSAARCCRRGFRRTSP